jgi:hypothetical protein
MGEGLQSSKSIELSTTLTLVLGQSAVLVSINMS